MTKNNNCEQEDFGGLTKGQIDKMSNHELKEYQRNQSDEEVNYFKRKLKNSIIGAAFFFVVSANFFFNPFLFELSFIVPLVATLVFLVKTFINKSKLNTAKISRVGLEIFFRDIGV